MVMPAGQLLSKEADDQVFKIHDSLSDALNIPRVKDDEQI